MLRNLDLLLKFLLVKRVCIVVYFLFLFLPSLRGQMDTEFWFVAPQVSQNGGSNLDRPVVFRINTHSQAAVVTIEQPANSISQAYTIPANSTQTFDATAWISTVENGPANVTLTYGFKITSTAPVTIYYEVVSGGGNRPDNPEAFILKGRNALGTRFYIPSQNLVPNHSSYSPTPYNAFDIVSTENNTTVNITPSNNINGHSAGVTFSVTLNRGETYSAVAASQAANQHLNGSLVTSDKPIAITVTDDLLSGSYFSGICADLTGDQIVPVEKTGKEYIAIKGLLDSPGDHLFVTATQNATTIKKDGVLLTTLNAGQTYSFPIGANLSTYVETSENAYVWQLSGSTCELGATLLPHISCTGSNSVSYTRSSDYQLYINVLVPNGGQGNFLVNNNASVITAGMFTAVPGNNAWLIARVLLPLNQFPQNSVITVTNATAKFHLAVIDINSGGTSYGYFSDYGNNTVTATVHPDLACVGDTLKLGTSSYQGAIYEWTGPGGFYSQLANPVIPNATSQNSGWYYLDVTVPDCGGKDSVFVNVYEFPDLKILTNDTVLCSYDSLQLQASGATNYSWTPNLFLSNANIANPIVKPTQNITYYLKGNIHPRCPRIDSVVLQVIPTDVPNLGRDTILCDGDSMMVYANSTYASHYFWSSSDTTASIKVNRTGKYWVKTEVGHCDGGSDTIEVVFHPYPSLKILTNDTVLCSYDSLQLSATGALNYNWTPNLFLSNASIADPVAKPTQDITYYLEGSIHPKCVQRDSVTLLITKTDGPSLIGDTILCEGDSIKLTANSIYATSYFWSNNDTSAVITVNKTGNYWVKTKVNNCYGGVDTVDIVFYPYPELQILTNDTIVCEGAIVSLRTTGASTYNWSPSHGLSNPNVANPIATPDKSITYYITGSIYEQCKRTDSINIQVLTVEAPRLRSDTTLCEGDTLVLYAGINAPQYLWSTGQQTASIAVSKSGKYWVQTAADICWGGSDTIEVMFSAYPDLQIHNSDTVICENESIHLEASGALHYDWSPGDYLSNRTVADPIASPQESITYYLKGSIDPQCVAVDSIKITISPLPDIDAFVDRDTIKCFEESVQLHASGGVSYNWEPADLFDNPHSSDPIASLTSGTLFYVIGKNEYGCAAADSISITLFKEAVFFVPNAFSPNGDGNNDFFKPIIHCDLQLTNFSVYNRYGEPVFSADKKEPGWDGTFKGKNADVGTYYWYIEGLNEYGKKVRKKGDVILMR